MKKTILSLTLLLGAGIAHASIMFGDAGGGNVRTGDGFSLGVEFTFTNALPMFVTALGLYDPSGNALATSHEIGLWDVTAGNIMIADGTITAGTTNSGTPGFLYVNVGWIPFTSGDVYRLAAYFSGTGPGSDQLLDCCQGASPTANGSFSSLSGIFTPLNTVGSLSEPTGHAGHAYVGPNLQFGPAPEPGTAGLAAVAAGLLWGFRRRLKRRS